MQTHLDRLSAIDASFLTNESSDSHMHVGAVLIFEGPPPAYNDFLDHVRSSATWRGGCSARRSTARSRSGSCG